MPFKSCRVVTSALNGGGFWFQSGWSRVSSVREGQFMAAAVSRQISSGSPAGNVREGSK